MKDETRFKVSGTAGRGLIQRLKDAGLKVQRGGWPFIHIYKNSSVVDVKIGYVDEVLGYLYVLELEENPLAEFVSRYNKEQESKANQDKQKQK